MVKNWDTETAKTCRLPELKSDACETCRDKRYCEVHKHGLVQMSIWDILPEEEEQPLRDCGRRCDCALFSLNCYIKRGYVRADGKWLRNEDGSIMIIGGECDWKPEGKVPEGWERIPDAAVVTAIEDPKEYQGEKNNPFMIYPDMVAKGRVNRIPCIIGYLTGVSGYGECFETLVPKFFKRTTIAPCPLKDYCLNNPAGCDGRTWWCARTKDEVKEE